MKINKFISHKKMRLFFAQEIKAISRWPYDTEGIELSRLPGDVRYNPTPPEAPWHIDVNDDYMEFRRSPFWMVSGEVFMGFILSLLSISFLLVTVSSFFALGYSPHLFFAYVVTAFFCIAVLPSAAKIAFLTPHYLPIRFNRKTQKIYVADLKIEGGIFFRKIKLTFREMDWKDVEAWSVSRRFAKNSPYFGLHLVENTSNEISLLKQTRMYATRAPWTNEEWERQRSYIPKIWSYCQHYMAFMPVPDESTKPKPFVFLKNNWLFKWPEEMDARSKSSGDTV
ncbi:hypothetical protein O7747_19480 [Escherichia albertii]|uniref:DUF6708 domain-containing protein n=2 Tax=Escherichia albertii TaxID=208962 RepID=UPI0013314429|nr:DUF6708 domain-containing protein [Escherichia albertii]KAF0950318.1 hypothetical protein AQU20_08810 [Escherichia albertii]MCZ7518809.1 hypothetical protein [Escherichia albertii]